MSAAWAWVGELQWRALRPPHLCPEHRTAQRRRLELTRHARIHPVHPARRSLEVVGLLVTLYALVVGPFHHWRATVLFFYAAVTSNLIAITNA